MHAAAICKCCLEPPSTCSRVPIKKGRKHSWVNMQCSSGSLGQVQLQGQMLGNLVINGQHPTIILYCNKAKRCCHQLHYNMQSQHPGQKKGRKNDCCPRPTLASSMLSHNLQLLMAYDNCQVHGQVLLAFSGKKAATNPNLANYFLCRHPCHLPCSLPQLCSAGQLCHLHSSHAQGCSSKYAATAARNPTLTTS